MTHRQLQGFRRSLAQKPWQPHDVGGDAPGFVAGEQMSRRATARLLLEIDVGQRLPVAVVDGGALAIQRWIGAPRRSRAAASSVPMCGPPERTYTLRMKLLSGGQSGVDRAVLDVALARGIAYSGWCPKGGWAEDFPEPPGVLANYPQLAETPLADPAQRTEWNVRDADAYLIVVDVVGGLEVSHGTALARDQAARVRRCAAERAARLVLEIKSRSRARNFALLDQPQRLASHRVASKQELRERIMAGIEDVNRHPVIHTWSYRLAEAA
jgi:Circularly permutated YpsA SLOG family